jgi:hypothetical protein
MVSKVEVNDNGKQSEGDYCLLLLLAISMCHGQQGFSFIF